VSEVLCLWTLSRSEGQSTFISLRSDAAGGVSLSICLRDIAVVTYEVGLIWLANEGIKV
jgi:hypothetical protein